MWLDKPEQNPTQWGNAMATLSIEQVRKMLKNNELSDQQIMEMLALMEEFAQMLLA